MKTSLLLALVSFCLFLGGCACTRSGPQAEASSLTNTNKRLVTEFFTKAFVDGDLAGAAKQYVSADTYIQHSPNGPDGRAFLIDTLHPILRKINYRAEIKRVIAEKDLVVVHSHGFYDNEPPLPNGEAAVDIFRVTDGKIVEHWDVLQAVPEESANTNTMF